MMQRSNVILIALKVQNSFKQSFGAKVQRRSVQSRSDLQSKRRVERLYWRLLPGSDKVVVSYCWAELGLQMVMVKIRYKNQIKYKGQVATPKRMKFQTAFDQGPTGRGFRLRDGTGRVLAKKFGYRDGSGWVMRKF